MKTRTGNVITTGHTRDRGVTVHVGFGDSEIELDAEDAIQLSTMLLNSAYRSMAISPITPEFPAFARGAGRNGLVEAAS